MPDIGLLIPALLLAGVAGGILAGLLGVGGGIVIVPALEFVLEWYGVPSAVRMHIAVATSLAVIIPTSVASARAHHRRGAVDVDLARRWAAWIGAGSAAGVVIASQLSGPTLTAIFGVFVFLVAVKMALPLDDKMLSSEVPQRPLMAVVPTAIGTISSMMGIGGGTLSVPTLTVCGEPIHRAVGTSALFGLLISVPGAIAFVLTGWNNAQLPPGNFGYVSLAGFLLIAPTTVLTAPLGARLAHALKRRTLSLLFGLFLLLVGVRMLVQALQG